MKRHNTTLAGADRSCNNATNMARTYRQCHNANQNTTFGQCTNKRSTSGYGVPTLDNPTYHHATQNPEEPAREQKHAPTLPCVANGAIKSNISAKLVALVTDKRREFEEATWKRTRRRPIGEELQMQNGCRGVSRFGPRYDPGWLAFQATMR